MELIERIRQKIRVTQAGCWEWTGHINHGGYAMLGFGYKRYRVHRLTYEIFNNKPIPSGLVIDHLCRNRKCVNPEHLEAVPLGVNVLRGQGLAALNSRKTHCPKGHPLTEENVYRVQVRARGRCVRVCKTCRIESMRMRRAKEAA